MCKVKCSSRPTHESTKSLFGKEKGERRRTTAILGLEAVCNNVCRQQVAPIANKPRPPLPAAPNLVSVNNFHGDGNVLFFLVLSKVGNKEWTLRMLSS